jgi:transcriptional regulator with XRE-family HTH domain
MTTSQLVRLAQAYRLIEAENGRSLREESGVSLRQMAAALGTNPGELSRWERGISRPRTANALRWLDAVEAIAEGLRGGTNAGVRR